MVLDCNQADTSPMPTNGVQSHTCAHVLDSRPPIVQNTISCATCYVTTLSESSRLDAAVRKAPIAIPESSSVVVGVTPARVATA